MDIACGSKPPQRFVLCETTNYNKRGKTQLDINIYMFKLKIICLGKFKEKAFVDLEREYLKRLRLYAKITIEELKEVSYKTTGDIERVRAEEAEMVLKRIPKDAIIIVLDEKGVVRGSVDFSQFLSRLISINREIVCVIGSGAGIDKSLRQAANHVVSLSPLTFTHNFARVLLEEQIYRACTIMEGKEYHKD